ncbi:hypothetical protein GWI33_005085 [Rhynchophorus ferrugineus]|uniref:Uncharacterized protein n=1 Tax=Rhynchophorus ferrugineus TaxID=354439 RepID=A0A834IM51_RHYFE|nr:hypothetical protein GWI33_005085 [Rhynchophorus ferrugineus]
MSGFGEIDNYLCRETDGPPRRRRVNIPLPLSLSSVEQLPLFFRTLPARIGPHPPEPVPSRRPIRSTCAVPPKQSNVVGSGIRNETTVSIGDSLRDIMPGQLRSVFLF